MNKRIYFPDLTACLALIAILFSTLIFSGCASTPAKPAYKNIVTYKHPEVNHEDKIIYIVGAEGPNHLSFVRICTQEGIGQWTDHRLAYSIQPGEVMVIEQPNWFPVRRLCAYSRDRYANYISTQSVSTVVHPGDNGPGIYYLGAVKTPDSYGGTKINDLYLPEITDTIREELIKAVRAYPNLKTINFDLEQE